MTFPPLANPRRRRHRGPSGNDISTLVTALGGDSTVPAFYDTRYNVSTSGATATAWDDARGTVGYAPQLVATGTPAWDATNKVISTDGSSNLMKTATNALFELTTTGRSIVVIGAWPSNAGNLFGGVNISDNSAKWLGLMTSSSKIGCYAGGIFSVGGADIIPVSPVAVGASRRMVVASATLPLQFGSGVIPTGVGVGLYASSRVGPNRNYYQQGSTWTSGGWMLRVGDLFGSKCALNLRAILVLDHAITAADMVTIKAWAVTNHAIVEDVPTTGMLLCDGDSLTYGLNGLNGTSDYPTQLRALLPAGWDHANLGIASRTGATLLLAFQTRVAPMLRVSTVAKKVYVCFSMHNDLAAGTSAAQAAQNIIDACQAAKDAGATGTVACTQPPSVQIFGPAETARIAANLILTGTVHSSIDAVADLAGDVRLQNKADTTYFDADQIHYTAAGYGVVKQLVYDGANAVGLWT